MKIIAIHHDAPEAGLVAEAADVLARGGLVAFPTETVYGLGADALSAAAVAAVFAAKGRPPDNPLIVHVATVEQFRALAPGAGPRAEALARREAAELRGLAARLSQLATSLGQSPQAIALRAADPWEDLTEQAPEAFDIVTSDKTVCSPRPDTEQVQAGLQSLRFDSPTGARSFQRRQIDSRLRRHFSCYR